MKKMPPSVSEELKESSPESEDNEETTCSCCSDADGNISGC